MKKKTESRISKILSGIIDKAKSVRSTKSGAGETLTVKLEECLWLEFHPLKWDEFSRVSLAVDVCTREVGAERRGTYIRDHYEGGDGKIVAARVEALSDMARREEHAKASDLVYRVERLLGVWE